MVGGSWLSRLASLWRRAIGGDPSRWSDAQLGRAGERTVARRLRRAGGTLLAERLASSSAEVDLLSRDATGRLWLHEVKTTRCAATPRPAQGGRPGAGAAARPALEGRVGAGQRRRLEAARSALAAARREEVGIMLWSVSVDERGKFFALSSVLSAPRKS